jgi:hypothetical protein
MWQYAAKVLVTAVLVVAVTELSKRGSFWGAALASLPITSVLAFMWLHVDGGPPEQIAGLSMGIFWLVIPSLALFVALAALLRSGVPFWASLAVSCVVTSVAYVALVAVLERLGVRI